MILYGVDVLECNKDSSDELGEKMKKDYHDLLMIDN